MLITMFSIRINNNLRGSLYFKLAVLVISIVIDCDRTLLQAFCKKIKFRWKWSPWHIFECLYMRWILSCQKTKKWSFGLFRPNLPQLGLFHPYFVSKNCFRVISMIKIAILDHCKAISLIFEKIKSKFQKSKICT